MMDVMIIIAPFVFPFDMLTFLMNMINAPITILFMWLKYLSFNQGSKCLMFVANFVSIFTRYISMI
jgi:hypothetical protein